MPSGIFDELLDRGLVAQASDEDALRKAFNDGPVTYYCGFDPTAPSLHIGNLVQILFLRRLQLAGNLPLALVGGATGLIGDPKMTAERVLNSKEVVAEWVERLRSQIAPLLDFEGKFAARMVNNLDWTAQLSTIDFLRDVGKHFRLSQMLAKETVAKRLATEEGMSFTEFSYACLQGNDFLQLHRRFGCILQTGGNDQWTNLLAGTDLIHKADGHDAFAMTTPLITKADGTKFGKTESGTVWLDPHMTTPYAFHQFWLNSADADVIRYINVFTFRSPEQIADLERSVQEEPHLREAQKALADDATRLVHGDKALETAKVAARALFGNGDLQSLDKATLGGIFAGLQHASAEGSAPLIVDLVASAGFAKGRGDARRLISQGGVYLNNAKIDDPEAVLAPTDLLYGKWALLRRGKKSLAVVEV